ncbi:MAG: hypothetical protein M1831_001953 [Alyxoria varia]|nr:MAG: hypothetical protein M1831_001953 [Alyxoria varia]
MVDIYGSGGLDFRTDIDGRRLLTEIQDASVEGVVSVARQAIKLDDEGLYTAAAGLYKEALDECIALQLDPQHQLPLFCMNMRTAALTNQGRYKEAIDLSTETFNLVCKSRNVSETFDLVGKDPVVSHDSYLSCTANRAHLFRSLGDIETASNLAFGAIDQSDGYPLDTMIGANLCSIVARIYRDRKRRLECELLSQNVVEASHMHVGDCNRFTFISESQLAMAMAWRGKTGIAEKVARRAYEGLGRIVGARHPYTLRAGRRLADCLSSQKRGYEAQPLLETTLEAQKQHFGYNHVATVSTLASLGAVYSNSDRKATALRIFLKASRHRDGLRNVSSSDDFPVKSKSGRAELVRDEASQCHVEASDNRNRDNSIGPLDWETLGYSVADAETISKAAQGERFEDPGLVGSLVRFSAAKGDTNLLKTLLDVHGDVGLLAEGGFWGTALSAACCREQEEVIDELLKRNINANVRRGMALRDAASFGYKQIVEKLMMSGADVDAFDAILGSPLKAALAGSHTDIVGYLVQSGASLKLEGKEGFLDDPLFGTPLQRAALGGDKRLVDLLLDEFLADPNETRGHFGSALQLAALENHTSICKRLVDLEPGMDSLEQALRDAMAAHCKESIEVLLQAVRDKRQMENSNEFVRDAEPQVSAAQAVKISDASTLCADKDEEPASLPVTKLPPSPRPSPKLAEGAESEQNGGREHPRHKTIFQRAMSMSFPVPSKKKFKTALTRQRRKPW